MMLFRLPEIRLLSPVRQLFDIFLKFRDIIERGSLKNTRPGLRAASRPGSPAEQPRVLPQVGN